jgi:hypothetical protein
LQGKGVMTFSFTPESFTKLHNGTYKTPSVPVLPSLSGARAERSVFPQFRPRQVRIKEPFPRRFCIQWLCFREVHEDPAESF